ncbi:MAG: rod shape-determining protein MreD [Chloroflexia bacterium]|jgi:rod shape-determining protein MreD|nr:rod shape-determining protein MreD [Chloroflexia bacterium]
MARIVFALLIGSAAIAQGTVVPALNPIVIAPNFVLVLLMVWSALRGTIEGLMWLIGVGPLLDLLAMDPLGTNGLALLIVVLLAGPARRRFFHSGMIFPIVLVVIATLGHALVLLLLRGGGFGPVVILQALLHALLLPPLYYLAGWMDRWVLEAKG